MRATGIIRRTDDLGRVVIPKEIRKSVGIAEGTPIEMFTIPEGIVLRKYNTGRELSKIVTMLSTAVDCSADDLTEEKLSTIRQHICGIKDLLKMEQ